MEDSWRIFWSQCLIVRQKGGAYWFWEFGKSVKSSIKISKAYALRKSCGKYGNIVVGYSQSICISG